MHLGMMGLIYDFVSTNNMRVWEVSMHIVIIYVLGFCCEHTSTVAPCANPHTDAGHQEEAQYVEEVPERNPPANLPE
jgi:hypothetical protein